MIVAGSLLLCLAAFNGFIVVTLGIIDFAIFGQGLLLWVAPPVVIGLGLILCSVIRWEDRRQGA
jgi:hypothetical protein